MPTENLFSVRCLPRQPECKHRHESSNSFLGRDTKNSNPSRTDLLIDLGAVSYSFSEINERINYTKIPPLNCHIPFNTSAFFECFFISFDQEEVEHFFVIESVYFRRAQTDFRIVIVCIRDRVEFGLFH